MPRLCPRGRLEASAAEEEALFLSLTQMLLRLPRLLPLRLR